MAKNTGNDAWSAAWSERYAAPEERRPGRIKGLLHRRGGGSRPGRYALLAAVVIAVVAAPFAVAAAGSGRFTSNDPRYTLLSRNTNNGDGGSMAAACTSNASTAQAAHEPCLNMVNKGTGFAAAFRTRGLTGFRLQTSGSGTATPFVLDKNATGKVDFLNADQLDGKDSTEIGREPFALVDAATNPTSPTLSRKNGVDTVARTSAGTYTVTFTDDVSQCTFQVTSADNGASRTVSAANVSGQAKQVQVVVRDAGTGAPTDDSFQIAAHC